MPYTRVETEPELFLEWKGVKVWNTYYHDDFDEGADGFTFTLDERFTDSTDKDRHPDIIFDLQDLEEFQNYHDEYGNDMGWNQAWIAAWVIYALEEGLVGSE